MLDRIADELEGLNERHRAHSAADYLEPDAFGTPISDLTSSSTSKRRNNDA
jgi:hypothetical protein